MITVNGEKVEIRKGETLLEMVEERGYRLAVIAVEYNGMILNKEAYGSTVLSEGDRVEIVSFVGGG